MKVELLKNNKKIFKKQLFWFFIVVQDVSFNNFEFINCNFFGIKLGFWIGIEVFGEFVYKFMVLVVLQRFQWEKLVCVFGGVQIGEDEEDDYIIKKVIYFIVFFLDCFFFVD